MIEVLNADLFNPSHGQAVLYLLNEYAEGEMGGNRGLSEYAKANLIEKLAAKPGTHVFLAYVRDLPVGLAICFEGFSTFSCKPLLNIHDIVVTEEYRGRGISKRLLLRAEETAHALGCCKLTLEVLEGNLVAQAAYKSFGFSGYELDPNAGKAMFWQKLLPQG